MKTNGMAVAAVVSVAGLAGTSEGQTVFEDSKFSGADTLAGDVFGTVVAMHDQLVLLGAPGDEFKNPDIVGSAYLMNAASGEQLFKLEPPEPLGYLAFGLSVSLSESLAIVGAPSAYDDDGTGAVYAFDSKTGEYVREYEPDDAPTGVLFGYSVAANESVVVVGSPENTIGSVFIFDAATGEQLHKLTPSNSEIDDLFGQAVAVTDSLVIVTAPLGNELAGIAYVFDIETGEELFTLTASDPVVVGNFGISASASDSIAVIGATNNNDVAYQAGAAYIFDLTTGQELHKLVPSDPSKLEFFGISVATDGESTVVGTSADDMQGHLTGSAYVFEVSTGEEILKLRSSSGSPYDHFGLAVAVQGSSVIVTAALDDDAGSGAGAGYLFKLDSFMDCPGDATGDDTVDLADLNLVLANFGSLTSEGDATGDGQVDLADLNLVLANFGANCD